VLQTDDIICKLRAALASEQAMPACSTAAPVADAPASIVWEPTTALDHRLDELPPDIPDMAAQSLLSPAVATAAVDPPPPFPSPAPADVPAARAADALAHAPAPAERAEWARSLQCRIDDARRTLATSAPDVRPAPLSRSPAAAAAVAPPPPLRPVAHGAPPRASPGGGDGGGAGAARTPPPHRLGAAAARTPASAKSVRDIVGSDAYHQVRPGPAHGPRRRRGLHARAGPRSDAMAVPGPAAGAGAAAAAGGGDGPAGEHGSAARTPRTRTCTHPPTRTRTRTRSIDPRPGPDGAPRAARRRSLWRGWGPGAARPSAASTPRPATAPPPPPPPPPPPLPPPPAARTVGAAPRTHGGRGVAGRLD
jgi:hypothetical protein